MSSIVWLAPVAFVVGVLVGLAASSRWRITRRPPPSDDPRP